MPTLEPHQHRQVAESFGADVQRYDRARPGYPPAMVRRIVDASPGPDVLDVGCGTGIEARQFQAEGCTVLGVEPDARMAEFARHRGLDVEVATFEDWEPAGRTFDTIVAGQSWHWVDPVVGATKAAKLLRPGGRLAVFAHVFEPPSAVADAFAAVYRRVAPDSPFNTQQAVPAADAYEAMFSTFANGTRTASGFGEPERWRFDWQHDYTRDEWLDLLPTQGPLTRLAPDLLSEVLTSVGATIDTIGGGFTMDYVTLTVTAAFTGPR